MFTAKPADLPHSIAAKTRENQRPKSVVFESANESGAPRQGSVRDAHAAKLRRVSGLAWRGPRGSHRAFVVTGRRSNSRRQADGEQNEHRKPGQWCETA